MSVDVQDPETAEQTAPSQGLTEVKDTALTRTGAMGFGLAPSNFDEAWRMAAIFARSDLVPKQYKGKPDDVLVAMQYGAEIGLPPMASLQSVAVINGKPGVYSDGFLGVIQSKPAYLKHQEYYVTAAGETVKGLRVEDYANDETKAVSAFWRRGNPDPFVSEFSIGAAKRAKLWGKEGPWAQYPARMLLWRARGYAGRDAFSAELRGIRTVEELRDMEEALDVSVSAVPAEPVRRSEKAIAFSLVTELADPPKATTRAAKPTAAAAPANPPAVPSGPFKAIAQPTTTPHMVITETFVKTLKDAPMEYEISATVQEKGKTPVAFTLVTVDEELYKRAASCEGTGALFDLTWQASERIADGKKCKVLVAVEAAG